ncbi:enoyl-CoA hydratase/isomerase family protein [Nocardia sp. CA-107356]|uniref:enoyl-CoA hydratase/isomerase family protein n=1 Tax=Nocardia sp. CA-107356 TaxID=3239972 RepID=UPI003D94A050
MSDATSYEVRGPAAWIRLMRPDKRNALNPDILAGIGAGLDRAERDGARAVVIASSGPVFCAGADLTHVLDGIGDLDGIARLLGDAGTLTRRIEAHPAPVVAAVNGAAVAGGLELVLACDLVVAAENATFADGHVAYGLFPGAGSSVRLPRLIGANRARHLMYTGGSLSAEQALALGIVCEVAPSDQLEAAVEALCHRLARGSRAGLARMKRVIREAGDLSLADGLELELAEARAHLRSPDVAEGLAAFAEGRRPRFAR